MDQQNTSMQSALQNPLILSKILERVPRSGKTLRLVCHFWNEITLSLPTPKVIIRLGSFLEDCDAIQFLCTQMEPKLGRSILAHATYLIGGLPCSLDTKLLHVSRHFGHCIENFSIAISNPDFLPEILQNSCPLLKTLEIKFKSERFESKSADLRPCILHNLISIKIIDDDYRRHPQFFKMTQWLLNSAPALTHFSYSGCQPPDLSRNKFIKHLRLEIPMIKRSNLWSANYMRKVNLLLDQVKDTVEVFWLSTDYLDLTSDVELKIPKMKKLKVFQNWMVDIFSGGDKMQDICTARIPTLQTLLIATTSGASLAKLFRNIMQEKDSFSGVKDLDVTELRSPRLISGLKTPFPNLERLRICLFEEDEPPFIPLQAYLKACGSLGLKHLEMDLSLYYGGGNVSEFLRDFSNCGELLAGLKTLVLKVSQCDDDLDDVENGMADMKQWLLRMKGLQDVHISGVYFRKET
ncbi:uncharacterized protein LOC110856168 [Folsomia candida]|uniref:uncharacterized protein LOC110856168 n=1 Tax=Folsomia candida TaxID=158441 RepID=UPI000B8EEFA3|nr:uncharacterized protein LOC110856168 [Folsomia candida]XP_021960320.1 uncharacterized protein LOC110856168 [Folsomia candida]XP_021960321.1 uncharacterized protein LOC110856168 [Folsomia candida]XP_035712797.1 uncharacterized protein LOC110856168 [Folsomia candida]